MSPRGFRMFLSTLRVYTWTVGNMPSDRKTDRKECCFTLGLAGQSLQPSDLYRCTDEDRSKGGLFYAFTCGAKPASIF